MVKVLLKAGAATFISLVATLFLVTTVVPALGGVVDGNAWLMSVLCPIAIAFPASFFTFWQGEKFDRTHRALKKAHADLEAAHALLAERSRRDPMTGMYNREGFFAAVDAHRNRSMEGALLIIDADHFKKINDTYGHQVGDGALLLIAEAIQRAVREGDPAGRIGGEEFAVYLPGADEEELAYIAERIRREVERTRFQPDGGDRLGLTVSLGGRICRQTSIAEALREADRRLYEAKRLGRNKAVVEPSVRRAA